jgi:hypothetical protein
MPTKLNDATRPIVQNNSTADQDLNQNKYDFRYLVFPNDLGMDNQAHYMIININVPTALGSRKAAGQYESQFTVVEPDMRSKVDMLRGFTGITPINSGGDSGTSPWLGLPRQTRRIQESIALFMPTPLVYNSQNIYEEISLTALAGKLGVAVATRAAKAIGLGNVAKKIINSVGEVVSTAATVAQNPINPAIEILFTNTPVRQFTFELLMAPRNEKESQTIKAIVKTLRFHAAPEINPLSFGLTWIPPAEFDVTFFNKGVENTNILRINTCVLERIEVDYAPTGGVYSTFRNGHPVAVRLSLGFRELEPIHKLRVLQNF